MKKIFLLATFAFLAVLAAPAQTRPQVYTQTDLTSAYLWRGEKNGGVSIQPVLGLKWRGLHVYAWGNVLLCPPSDKPDKHEIDLFLKYNVTPALTVGFKDVYLNTRGDGVFSFGPIPHAANGLDAIVAYNFKYVSAEWTTTIAGYDGYNHKGKRSYGSYLLISAPFSWAKLDWDAQVGVVPYYCSRYSEDRSSGFHVNMCALKTSHTFGFPRSHIALTPYMQLMLNPSARTAHFQVGARFLFAPGS